MASVKKRQRPGHQADYRVRWTAPDGKAEAKCFGTLHEAKAWAREVEDSLRRGNYVSPQATRMRLAEWAERWWEHSPGRPTSRARDLSYLRTHVLPRFGGHQLGAVTRSEVQAWVHDLQADKAPATVHKAVQVLSKVLRAAMLDGRLAVNACTDVALPPIPDEEARFLTPDELVALEDAMPERWADLVPFIADVGLRIGEVAALRWRDVDVFRHSVTVREVLTEVPMAVSKAASGLVLGPPKTRAGRRTVPMLTTETADRLAARQVGHGPDAFVFANPDGSPLRPNNFRARVWRPAVAAAGLTDPAPTPHALRHTAVAHWIAAGVVDPFKLKTWAGHRDVGTTSRIYGHLLPLDATEHRDQLSAMRAAARDRSAAMGKVVSLAAHR